MALFAQFDKMCALSRRESNFTDEKTGKPMNYQYITGFDAVSGNVFTDLQISPDSPIKWEQIKENGVYDCVFNVSIVKDAKNATRITSVKVVQQIGTIEVKAVK